MPHNTFDAANPISILNFLSTFKMTCHDKGMSEGARMGLFHFSIRNLAASTVNARVRLYDTSSKSLAGSIIRTATFSTTCWLRMPPKTSLRMQYPTLQTSLSRIMLHLFRMHRLFETSCYVEEPAAMRAQWRESSLVCFPSRSLRQYTIIGPWSICRQWMNLSNMKTLSALSEPECTKPHTMPTKSPTVDKSHRQSRTKTNSLRQMSNYRLQILTRTWETAQKTSSRQAQETPRLRRSQLRLIRLLDSIQYCSFCFQASHVTSACTFIKNPAEFVQKGTEGVKRMFGLMLNSRRRSLNWSPRQKCHNSFAQRGRNYSPQNLYDNRRIRPGPAPSPPACS